MLLCHFHLRASHGVCLIRLQQAEFEEDRRLRLEREEIIVKQLTDHEEEVADRFQKQIVSRLFH